jgi:TPR repeat protein
MFQNKSGGGIKLYWITPDGKRKLYTQIDDGKSAIQATFMTNPWVVTDSSDQCLGIVMPGSAAQDVLIGTSHTPIKASACSDGGLARLSDGVDSYNHGQVGIAFADLKTAADCGNSDAQVNLGYMYARGQGAPTDQGEALRLYQLSADQGNSEGMNAIGFKYAFGSGVSMDMATAIKWVCKAVRLGNPRALNNLGTFYFKGTGVSQDTKVARDLWQQAADHGNTNGTLNIGASYLASQNPDERKLGVNLILQAAMSGNMEAQEVLRRNGYNGPLPGWKNEAAMMFKSVPEKPGHAPVCDMLSSM